MRFPLISGVLVVSASAALSAGVGTRGDVTIADPYAEYFQRGKVRFDNVQELLLAYRRSYDRADPALAWVQADGRRGGRISPLEQLPKGHGFDIGAVAAGPQSVLVAGVVQAGERELRLPPQHVIHIYDHAGALRRQWVMNPWHVHEMAVDGAGRVYTLGHRIDGRRDVNLIRRHTCEGIVDREFLPSRTFPTGDLTVSPDRGDNQFWIDGDRLRAYMAESDELFEFDLDGKQQRRTSLHEPLARLARDHHGARAEIVTLASDVESACLLAQVRIWTEGDEDLSFACARLFLDGRRPRTIETADGTPLATPSFPLMGRIEDDVLFLNRYTATILRR